MLLQDHCGCTMSNCCGKQYPYITCEYKRCGMAPTMLLEAPRRYRYFQLITYLTLNNCFVSHLFHTHAVCSYLVVRVLCLDPGPRIQQPAPRRAAPRRAAPRRAFGKHISVLSCPALPCPGNPVPETCWGTYFVYHRSPPQLPHNYCSVTLTRLSRPQQNRFPTP